MNGKKTWIGIASYLILAASGYFTGELTMIESLTYVATAIIGLGLGHKAVKIENQLKND